MLRSSSSSLRAQLSLTLSTLFPSPPVSCPAAFRRVKASSAPHYTTSLPRGEITRGATPLSPNTSPSPDAATGVSQVPPPGSESQASSRSSSAAPGESGIRNHPEPPPSAHSSYIAAACETPCGHHPGCTWASPLGAAATTTRVAERARVCRPEVVPARVLTGAHRRGGGDEISRWQGAAGTELSWGALSSACWRQKTVSVYVRVRERGRCMLTRRAVAHTGRRA